MMSCRRVNHARTVVKRRGCASKHWCAWGEGRVLVCPLARRGEDWGERGAESGVRTRTPAKAADFKSAASACSAIPARDGDIVPGWRKGSVFEPR